MPVLQAQIQTDRATRYLVQFCKHAAAMGSGGHSARMHLHMRREVQVAAEWTDTSGSVTFGPWGRARLTADGNSLTVRIEAADGDRLTQIRDIITRDFERFSRRDPLAVAWQRLESPDSAPLRDAVGVPSGQRRGFPRSHLQTAVLALAVVLVVALHVGLAGSIVAESRWTGLAANVVVALVALKIALIAVARFKIRQRRATKRPDHT
ncbi:hypothetical protein EV384_0056 [Micromonospora kangleipakensis]|uniref:DUF2218 domain-containing protein n=1 Tax=Micromonospora kangleipakensis TaxID=1077942 RepID=A0A4V2GCE1_9ACTN|nr:DUF2218 domain-containing protein [Micromonospora kangleipakensis]RZU71726.1 hypothetical protein EV384_0056 [Micromonospora kangleipakensis]